MAKFIRAGDYLINVDLVTEIKIVSPQQVQVSFISAWPNGDDKSSRDGRSLEGEAAEEFLRGLGKVD